MENLAKLDPVYLTSLKKEFTKKYKKWSLRKTATTKKIYWYINRILRI